MNPAACEEFIQREVIDHQLECQDIELDEHAQEDDHGKHDEGGGPAGG